ncbi:cobalt-precorrin 5A hydrolase [Pseudodesulfovibrio sp.]|uniref:cobalt-precorrin 5A hydrolase n=1 Tax=Pseudodesulfovibrio sp. TaxID=2035812 RepID=UPI0026098DDF|nr:cobalt-precorrin 5A hydrolase [Pseudodesulfovibrio sp.]MDD3311951.1 cobalt-precorrin 5A hydrolase [Pseudodesulfovibrio sp.]
MSATVACYALTRRGLELAVRLAQRLGGEVFAPRRFRGDMAAHAFDSLSELVAETFPRYRAHVFVAASGIAVRCIAPHLRGKDVDPAVVCLDQYGRFAISLLSGHLGGGNELAERCANIVGGQAVITTATDSAGLPSLDMLAVARGLSIGNLDRVKTVNGAILDGRAVQVFDPDNWLGARGEHWAATVDSSADWWPGEPGVWVSVREDCPDDGALRLYPRALMLGVGCRRGTGVDEIFSHIQTVMRNNHFPLSAVGGLGSAEVKANEPGILEAAARLGVTPVFFSPERLDSVNVPSPSSIVRQHMGVGSVSEAAALLLSDGGELLVLKTKTETVTLAVAKVKRQA